jgi:NAD(P)-dependent dehydrogenase (short-subunit alcohol dehydrogenase family)/catechol 2,3-dioxygenase-like lactoylglutathione lyase family enzyme
MAHLNQIAMSVTDLRRTHAWYRQVFGFMPAGGTSAFKGYLAEKIQGVKGAASTCWWLADQQDYFQLELFEFEKPEVRPLSPDWRLCDIGYAMVGLHVVDFDAALSRLAEQGSAALSEPLGEPGCRRVCVRDPEGVLLEIMEDDVLASTSARPVRGDVPVVTRCITVSVADLEKSRVFFVDVLELDIVSDISLHTDTHEALWGLVGARRTSLLLRAGDVLVELVQYSDPLGRAQALDYRISDQGLLNIALGFRSRKEFQRIYQRCLNAGIHGNWRPLRLGAWSVVYVNDEQGFSVELLHVEPWYDGFMGFRPKPAPIYKRKKSMRKWDTALITGGGSGIGMEFARQLLLQGTSVAIVDRSEVPESRHSLEAVAQSVPATKVCFYQADVTDSAGLQQVVAAAAKELGKLDLAINSAGIQIAKPFNQITAQEFERVVITNLCGSRNLAAAALPHMQNGSQLALVASLAGLVPSHSYAAYNASKFGVVGLAGALRLECISQGIEVSVVCPPEIDTPMVVEERKTLPPVAMKLKDAAGSLELQPACTDMLRQLRKGRAMIIPSMRARMVARVARIFPGLMRWVSERIVLATP